MSEASAPGGSRGAFPGSPAVNCWPPIASSVASVATQSRYGPVWPKSLIWSVTRCGWVLTSSAGARPSFASAPGAKDSISTSARAQRLRRRARSPSCARSRRTPRLFELRCAKKRLVAPWNGGSRRETAPSGGSTRTTSAPKSARSRPASSPFSSARSRTRIPARGRSDTASSELGWGVPLREARDHLVGEAGDGAALGLEEARIATVEEPRHDDRLRDAVLGEAPVAVRVEDVRGDHHDLEGLALAAGLAAQRREAGDRRDELGLGLVGRDPAVREARRAREARGAVAADVDRHGPTGSRAHLEAVEVVEAAVVLDHAGAREQLAQDLDHLVAARAAVGVARAAPGELLRDPGEPDAEPDAVARERRRRAHGLRDEQRRADRELDHARVEEEPRGHRGHRRDRDPGIDERRVRAPEAVPVVGVGVP